MDRKKNQGGSSIRQLILSPFSYFLSEVCQLKNLSLVTSGIRLAAHNRAPAKRSKQRQRYF